MQEQHQDHITVDDSIVDTLQEAMRIRRPATIQLDRACRCDQPLVAHARWQSGEFRDGARHNVYVVDVVCSAPCGFAQETGQIFGLRG